MAEQATLDKLRTLRLHGMLEALKMQDQQPDAQRMSFEQRLALLVDQELLQRENTRYQRLLRQARLREPSACLEEIDYAHPRGLNREQIQNLGTCQWLEYHQSVCLTGPTGVGKTFLACALGHQACRYGYPVTYYRITDLLEALRVSRGDGSHSKFMRNLLRSRLLILDDFGLTPIGVGHLQDVFEIVEARHGNGATVIAAQLPLEHWHEYLGSSSIADAIVDRLLHGGHHIALKGESMRSRIHP